MPKETMITFTMSVPKWMNDELALWAERHERSKAAEIRTALRLYLLELKDKEWIDQGAIIQEGSQ